MKAKGEKRGAEEGGGGGGVRNRRKTRQETQKGRMEDNEEVIKEKRSN